MKLITAIIRPEQLTDVKQALFDSGINHMTAASVMGTATDTEQNTYRGVKREITLSQRIKLEIALKNSQVDTAVATISKAAKESGGSGKILIADLEKSITVWTGEEDKD